MIGTRPRACLGACTKMIGFQELYRSGPSRQGGSRPSRTKPGLALGRETVEEEGQQDRDVELMPEASAGDGMKTIPSMYSQILFSGQSRLR